MNTGTKQQLEPAMSMPIEDEHAREAVNAHWQASKGITIA
jgi:hypothetical protein